MKEGRIRRSTSSFWSWFLRGFLALFVAMLLTACIGGGGDPGVSQTGTGQDGKVKLSIWRTFDSAEVFTPMIEEFQRDNPQIELEYTQLPLEEYELVVSEALAAGRGPDIWSIRNDWVPRHKDKLIPMPSGLLAGASTNRANQDKSNEELLAQLFVPVVAADAIIDGATYGLPFYVDTLVLYRNKKLFDERITELRRADRDDDAEFLREKFNTWDDVQKAVELLTKRSGDTITLSGLAAGTATNIERAEDVVYAMMLQNATQMTSPEHSNATFHLGVKNQIDQTIFPGTEALTQFTSFADPKSPHYSWNESMPNDVAAFIDGKVAMIFGFQYYELLFAQTAPTLQFEAQPLPQVRDATSPTDYASYWIETVTKNAENPELTWNVLRTLVMDRGLDYRAATGRPDPSVVKLPPPLVDRPLGGTPFRFQQQSATDWYKTLRPDKVDTIFEDLITEVTRNDQNPQNAIELAAKKVSHLLQDTLP